MKVLDVKNIIKEYFAKQKDVVCAYLFGSIVSGKDNKFSDVDVAILFDNSILSKDYTRRSMSMMDDLSRILDKNIDIIVLNKASCFLKYQVFKDGLRIYESPKRKTRDFEARAMLEYFDFSPIKNRLEAALINGLKRA